MLNFMQRHGEGAINDAGSQKIKMKVMGAVGGTPPHPFSNHYKK